MRIRVTAAVVGLALLAVIAPAARAQTAARSLVVAPVDPSCAQHVVSVSLRSGQAPSYHVVTWLCGPADGGTVIVTVSGTTYNHSYWDFPLERDRYSFVHAATAAGFSVLNLDRIGIGASDHPGPLASDGDANAWVVHQLVQRLRTGTLAGAPFSKVVVAGHSQGSGITWHEAATYKDVDGLIITGLPAAPIGSSTPGTFASLYPAQLDPKFAGAGIPTGYTTTRPGTRGQIFYNRAIADPNVIAEDEALKDVFPPGEGTVAVGFAQTRSIHVPVLSVTGDRDGFFCDIPCSNLLNPTMKEQPLLYTSGTCLEARLIPLAGHDINLHPNAPEWYAIADAWTAKWIGDGAASPPTSDCPGSINP